MYSECRANCRYLYLYNAMDFREMLITGSFPFSISDPHPPCISGLVYMNSAIPSPSTYTSHERISQYVLDKKEPRILITKERTKGKRFMLEPNCYNNNFNSHIGLVVFGLVMFVQINSQSFVIVWIWKRFSFRSMPFYVLCSMYVCTYVSPIPLCFNTHSDRLVSYTCRPSPIPFRFSSRSPPW